MFGLYFIHPQEQIRVMWPCVRLAQLATESMVKKKVHNNWFG